MSHLTFATLSETEGSFSLDDLRSSPSPRQANVSLSFSSLGSCPLDYSDDVVSIVYPVSPVSQDDEDSDDNNDKNESPSSGSSSKLGRAEQAEGDEEISSENVETEIAKESHSKETMTQ